MVQEVRLIHGGSSVKNIGFDGYIDTWILRIYRRYIGEYFYMNIDISKINKNISGGLFANQEKKKN